MLPLLKPYLQHREFTQWGEGVQEALRALIEPIGCKVSERFVKPDVIEFSITHAHRPDECAMNAHPIVANWKVSQSEAEWLKRGDRDPLRFAEFYAQQLFDSLLREAKARYLESRLDLGGMV